ncbi:hypothetical protein [Paenalcaligenes suwonensis]|uniref:hypothetical protein n=1 Tax=Paenalcaligenes suwonensis TaxID=1202713 RepID=UPI0014093E24|nr:hypothetical protein [Paenalcaligenes suwonensis]NHC62193.1 hypothetical protein [Paenalcaligenes suwonensis]
MLSTFEQENPWLVPVAKLEGKTLMEHLYGRFNGMYPYLWKANFTDMDAITDWEISWAEAFADEGIKPDDIATGLKGCRTMFPKPPSLTEFLGACRPYLEPSTAFHEAVAGMQARAKGENFTYSHPAIFFAAVAAGQHDIMNGSYVGMQERWKKALAAQLAKKSWPEIPAPVKALPPPVVSKAEAIKENKKVMSMVGGAVNNNRGLDWVHRVFKNHKHVAMRSLQNAIEVAEKRGIAIPAEVRA